MRSLGRWACAAALMCLGLPVHAMERGTLSSQRAYVSGGVGQEEIDILRAERKRYALKLVTAVRGSGDYLADAQVRVWDAHRVPVFDHRLDGPWLLIDLPPGRYDLEVVYGAHVQRRAITIRGGHLHEENFYVDLKAD